MKIYIGLWLQPKERQLISEAVLPADTVYFTRDTPDTKDLTHFLEAEVVFGNVPPEWLEKTQNLRWLQLNSAGINPYAAMDTERTLSGIRITNLSDFYGIPVAETAVGGILAFYRKLHTLSELQIQNRWIGGALRPRLDLLHTKEVLILGAGDIGMTIKRLLRAFSCPVTTISRTSSPNLDDIEDILPDADIVINTLPETHATVNVLNDKRLRLMKDHALFVNVGRGSVVDEEALVDALQESRIGGAVLDVTRTEPVPVESPLWEYPNVLLTQHTGGGYRQENENRTKVFVDNLSRYREGKPLVNLVDLERGY